MQSRLNRTEKISPKKLTGETKMNELKTGIDKIVSSGKCMGLMMLKNALKTTELEVLKNLDEKETLILDNSSFDRVWEFLTTFKKLTLFLEKEGNIFEIETRIGSGKEGMGYFNLFEKGCLNGHLLKESVASIALLKLPFMHLTSYQFVFLGKDGNSIFSLYLARENHQHDEKEVESFMNFISVNKNLQKE